MAKNRDEHAERLDDMRWDGATQRFMSVEAYDRLCRHRTQRRQLGRGWMLVMPQYSAITEPALSEGLAPLVEAVLMEWALEEAPSCANPQTLLWRLLKRAEADGDRRIALVALVRRWVLEPVALAWAELMMVDESLAVGGVV